jgi:hypothetical protein
LQTHQKFLFDFQNFKEALSNNVSSRISEQDTVEADWKILWKLAFVSKLKPINKPQIKRYPNPAKDVLKWDLPESENTGWVLELYHMKGKKHLSVDGHCKKSIHPPFFQAAIR